MGQLVCLVFMVGLYFAVSPASSARFGMFFAGSQVLTLAAIVWRGRR
jgi:hypothetical protein